MMYQLRFCLAACSKHTRLQWLRHMRSICSHESRGRRTAGTTAPWHRRGRPPLSFCPPILCVSLSSSWPQNGCSAYRHGWPLLLSLEHGRGYGQKTKTKGGSRRKLLLSEGLSQKPQPATSAYISLSRTGMHIRPSLQRFWGEGHN